MRRVPYGHEQPRSPVNLTDTVPIGRRFADYRDMFALDSVPKTVLGLGDGPSSFNAEATQSGWQVVSVDPLYRFGASAICSRYRESTPAIFEAIEKNPSDWDWSRYGSPTGLKEARDEAMRLFVQDFEARGDGPRYVEDSLPALKHISGEFDLALCSHLLFLYSEQFDTSFHYMSIVRALKLAPEVRVYPLVALDGLRSRHVGPVTAALRADGFHCVEERVDYAFQRGADTMLRVSRTDSLARAG